MTQDLEKPQSLEGEPCATPGFPCHAHQRMPAISIPAGLAIQAGEKDKDLEEPQGLDVEPCATPATWRFKCSAGFDLYPCGSSISFFRASRRRDGHHPRD
jgi:hypothetical protein